MSLALARSVSVRAEVPLAPLDFIYSVYSSALDREPSEDEILSLAARYNEAGSCRVILSAVLISSDAKSIQDQLGRADFVEYLYNSILQRPSDPAGKNAWIGFLAETRNRQSAIKAFIASEEAGRLCSSGYGLKP